MVDKITITRKIQIIINEEGEAFKAAFRQLYEWNEKVFRSANYVATHHYVQENIKEFFYMNNDIKIRLVDESRDGAGIFDTSRTNTTYRLLSDKFKGTTPMAMLSSVNNNVVKNFQSERVEYFAGKKSLRTYKRTLPMPVPRKLMGEFRLMESSSKGNYTFSFFGINFRTWFGKDLSGNKVIFDRAMLGEYKLCDSSIKLDGKKIFLLAVFQFDRMAMELDPDVTMVAELGLEVPIKCNYGKKDIMIGGREEYLHRRLAIQGALRRCQVSSRFNKNGKGRAKKMQAIEMFKQKEKDYVKGRLHAYTRKLVDLCVDNKCGKLLLRNQEQKEEIAKKDDFLLRNWGYFGLRQMLEYKCKAVGVEIIVE